MYKKYNNTSSEKQKTVFVQFNATSNNNVINDVVIITQGMQSTQYVTNTACHNYSTLNSFCLSF